jgi:hypothetical protein
LIGLDSSFNAAAAASSVAAFLSSAANQLSAFPLPAFLLSATLGKPPNPLIQLSINP